MSKWGKKNDEPTDHAPCDNGTYSKRDNFIEHLIITSVSNSSQTILVETVTPEKAERIVANAKAIADLLYPEETPAA